MILIEFAIVYLIVLGIDIHFCITPIDCESFDKFGSSIVKVLLSFAIVFALNGEPILIAIFGLIIFFVLIYIIEQWIRYFVSKKD